MLHVFDLRLISSQLRQLGLDWDIAVNSGPEPERKGVRPLEPLTVRVNMGNFRANQEARRLTAQALDQFKAKEYAKAADSLPPGRQDRSRSCRGPQ